MVSKIALIIFFLVYGLNHFVGIPGSVLILALAALVAGIAMIANN